MRRSLLVLLLLSACKKQGAPEVAAEPTEADDPTASLEVPGLLEQARASGDAAAWLLDELETRSKAGDRFGTTAVLLALREGGLTADPRVVERMARIVSEHGASVGLVRSVSLDTGTLWEDHRGDGVLVLASRPGEGAIAVPDPEDAWPREVHRTEKDLRCGTPGRSRPCDAVAQAAGPVPLAPPLPHRDAALGGLEVALEDLGSSTDDPDAILQALWALDGSFPAYQTTAPTPDADGTQVWRTTDPRGATQWTWAHAIPHAGGSLVQVAHLRPTGPLAAFDPSWCGVGDVMSAIVGSLAPTPEQVDPAPLRAALDAMGDLHGAIELGIGGNLATSGGRHDEAIERFEAALAVCDELAFAHNGLAWALLHRDPADVDGAVEHAERAVDLLEGRDSSSLDTLVRAYEAAGRDEDAAKAKIHWTALTGSPWAE